MKTFKLFAAILLLGLSSQNLSAQWSQVGYMVVNSTDTAFNVYQIRGYGGNLYGCSSRGVFRSTNNGDTWQSATYNVAVIMNEEIYSMFIAANGDIFAGSAKRLYKSINGGTSWTWLSALPDSLTYNDIAEMNGNIIVSYNKSFSAGGAYYSSDGGGTWTQSTGLINLPRFYFLIDNTVLYLGGRDNVYKSTDNGQSWTIAGTGFPASSGPRTVVKMGTDLFAADVGGNGLFVSYDNATTWTNVNPPVFTGFCQVFSIVESGTNLLASMDGNCNASSLNAVKLSTDTGTTWNTFMTGLTQMTYYPLVARNFSGSSFFAFEGNSHGRIFRYDVTAGVPSNQQAVNQIMVSPNPFTNEIIISKSRAGELVLYDVMGKEMLRLKTTEGETRLNTSHLAAGFYMLSYTEGGKRENVKVVKN